ncbi:MAG TPA: phenylalanine--tRNA ligase beta subunit-related protein [Thermoanaerobaculaceae bacterium]|nr:phenylalanine--tRNA ligase beta subunit-related protein [Thermoanaerobaculaceae bacterium]HPS79759.1 phenylalanine--tRNA ligase beta subunit-related protein [Thermoanaerobaculaceae bacterium]
MGRISYSIADGVFARFPGYVRGVVVATGVTNGPSPTALVGLLREAEASVRQRVTLDTVAAHPRIASWREAFRSLGIKPNEFRSSVEAMVRRALRDQELPSINTLVDIGNVVSLRHLVPVGGHAVDVMTSDIALRLATGAETFVAFGSDTVEHPIPGEVVFVEGDKVLTRRWSWRQATHTLTLPTTTAIEINLDGLPPVTPAEIEAISAETADLVRRFCGGTTRNELLSRANPRISIEG